ncbi:unnamed protein product [Staurois parvus]|uniref:Uncharacterized protein n=1 Tax=Staurois parvus TaxID=386267 RepID=A0ABN9CU29_9NEOB|nr:unnamed protein product [Staurois parvus]
MALHSRAIQSSVLTVESTHTSYCETAHSTQLTLYLPYMLTPSCPVPLVQCQCFLLALFTVLVSLGMSVTPSQFPPVSECLL